MSLRSKVAGFAHGRRLCAKPILPYFVGGSGEKHHQNRVVVSVVLTDARYAKAEVITLSCDGTMIDQRSSEKKAEPIGKIGVVVNFTENTVSFAGYVVPIIKADAAGVAFDGHGGLGSMKALVSGKFDRITGIVTVSTSTTAGTWNEWDLTNCKPAARLF